MARLKEKTARGRIDQIRRLQREAVEKFKALLRERTEGKGYRLLEPVEEVEKDVVRPIDLIVVLPRTPTSLEENLALRKPINDAYWQVWDEYQPKLGDLFFHVMVLYPNEVKGVSGGWRKVRL